MARRPKKHEEVNADKVGVDESLDTSLEVEEALQETELSDEDNVDEVALQCGEALYLARTNEGLTIQEVAKQLRLSSSQIEALEQDDFTNLPEATIVKGFIRNYAKLLKISAEPLLNAYVQLAPKKQNYNFALNPGINMKITDGGKSHKLHYFFVAIVLFLAAGVWFFYQSYVQKPNPVNPMPEISEVLPELSLPMSEQIEDVPTTALDMPVQQEETTVETAEKVVADEPAVESAELETVTLEKSLELTEETAGAEPVVVAEPPPVPGKTRLQFAATQETWLSVVNKSGREVYNKILYAGDRDTIDIWNPSEVVVGNAHGATLMVNGKSIDLAPYTRINVARYRFN